MAKVTQQLHLSQCTKAKHGMVERRDLFDGYLLAGRLVEGRACTTLAQATPTSDPFAS